MKCFIYDPWLSDDSNKRKRFVIFRMVQMQTTVAKRRSVKEDQSVVKKASYRFVEILQVSVSIVGEYLRHSEGPRSMKSSQA